MYKEILATDLKENDLLLWQRLKGGDKGALKIIYGLHVNTLLHYGGRFSKDKQTVEDCLHDLFVNIWQNREGLGPTDSIIRYLLTALRRRILKDVQKAGQTVGMVDDWQLEVDMDATVEGVIIQEEMSKSDLSNLNNAMTSLSERQKEAIYLKYHKNLPYNDISRIMDINYQSVRNLIHNAILKMRKQMAILWILLMTAFHFMD